MSELLNDIIGKLGPQVTETLTSNFNIDAGQAAEVLPQLAPLIVSGLKRKLEEGGEDSVSEILDQVGDSAGIENISETLLSKLNSEDSDTGLGGLLGSSGDQVANLLSDKLGLDIGMASKLIPSLGAMILGALSQKKEGDLGLSGLTSLIDRDGDGSILDDVAGFFGIDSGGIIGSILGGGDK